MSYFPDVPAAEWKNLLTSNANDYAKLKVYKPHEGEGKAEKVRFAALCRDGKSLNLEGVTQNLLNISTTAVRVE